MRVVIRSSYTNYPLTAVHKQMLKIIQHIEIKAEYVMSPEVNASQAWLDTQLVADANLKNQRGKGERSWGWIHNNLQAKKALRAPLKGSLMLILEYWKNAFLSRLENPGHNQREQIQVASNMHFFPSLNNLAESQLQRSQCQDRPMLDARPSQQGHFSP